MALDWGRGIVHVEYALFRPFSHCRSSSYTSEGCWMVAEPIKRSCLGVWKITRTESRKICILMAMLGLSHTQSHSLPLLRLCEGHFSFNGMVKCKVSEAEMTD